VVKGRSYSSVFAESLIELAREDDRVVGVTAAMPSGTGLRQFGQAFPDRMYDVGICEQHSFAFVQGLAVAGMRPVLAHYSTFAQRGYDQLFQEVVVQRDLGLVITLDRAGLVGEDGETHQGLYDLAWSRTLPGLALMAPKDGHELRAMLRWCHEERQKPTRLAGYLIRYPRDEVPECNWGITASAPLTLGKAEVIRQGDSGLMVWAYGYGVYAAWQALVMMGEAAAGVTLVNARFAKPLDQALLAELAATHRQVLSIEDHALPGGFGSCVAEAIIDADLDLRLTRLGVRDELVAHASRPQQLADHGIDPVGIAAAIRRLITPAQGAIPFTRVG
jgi:1-deoxy-D-xylulose-5-phosphate synthase